MNRVQFILSTIQGKVLDVGCLSGTLNESIRAKIEEKELYGIDTELKKEQENEHYKIADAEKHIPFENNFFDCIVAGEVIEHLHIPENFVKECSRILKQNGQIIITTPNRNSLINRMFKSYHAPLHFTLFTKQELTELLQKHGLKIQKFYCQPYTEESCDGSQKKWLFPIRKIMHHFLPNSLQEEMIILAEKVKE
ncbi:MAG: class I SAM-dependent methyltransferase [Candidatus Diapherotrites archaeon]|nr:class I SAM-dependent methyltransferase [Candidatus Diapherotrites archaeon]